MKIELPDVTYSKTVEGNFEVKLIRNNTVAATIVFPTEELAAEYTEFKQKLKADTDKLIAQIEAKLTGAVQPVVQQVEASIKPVVEGVESRVEANFVGDAINQKVDRVDPQVIRQKTTIDTSAKVSGDANKVIDTSAKVAKAPDVNWQESTKAKVVFPE